MPLRLVEVDPGELHVPPSRLSGADTFKLQRHIARFVASQTGMPLPWVYRGPDGASMIYNGVTRAARIAKLAPGSLIRVDVIRALSKPMEDLQKIRDRLR
jgi:hypothetical protein